MSTSNDLLYRLNDECKRLREQRDDLADALEIILANATMIPDPSMAGATDCYALPLDDIDVARAALKRAGR